MYARTVTRPKPLKSEVKSFPAPIGGWISNRSIAVPAGSPGAAVLDNFFPKAGTVKLRRGRELYTTLDDDTLPVTALFAYLNGETERLFAANEEAIYNITDGASIISVLSGQTGGDWQTVQFATTGGVFLIGVNGSDPGFIFNGTTFSTLTITFAASGLTTADMDYVWVYKNRLWFVQKNSLDAWYMEDAAAIAGDAVRFSLAASMGLGGSLLFGQNWSLSLSDQGGLGEQNVFVSTEGEVVIYQGVDPAEAATWSKVGIYRIGTPLGKRAFIRGGGDLAIATSVGLVPLSKAIELDVTSLNVATVSYPIADAWDNATSLRGLANWQCELWPELKMAVVSPPDLIGSSEPVLFVSNTETGAWARYTGWYALSMTVYKGQLYFGTTAGEVWAANVGGMDGEIPYTGTMIGLFEDLGRPASAKVAKIARPVSRSNTTINASCSVNFDYDYSPPSPPDSSTLTAGSLWGIGIWGQDVWGQGTPTVINQQWQSAGGIGYAIAPVYQVTSGSVAPIDDELIRVDVTYTTAAVVS